MRNIYLTFSFVIASGLLSAQNKDTKIADKLFDRYEYVDAAQEYLKLAQSGKADAYVYKQLADSYFAIPKKPSNGMQKRLRKSRMQKHIINMRKC